MQHALINSKAIFGEESRQEELLDKKHEKDSLLIPRGGAQSTARVKGFDPRKDIVKPYELLVDNYDQPPSANLGEFKTTYDSLYKPQIAEQWKVNMKSRGILHGEKVVVDGAELAVEEAVAIFDYTAGERINKLLRLIAKLKNNPDELFQRLKVPATYQPRSLTIDSVLENDNQKIAGSIMLDLALCHLMQNGLKKLPKLRATVYRLEHVWEDQQAFDNFYIENALIKFDAFTSTTRTTASREKLRKNFKEPPDVSLEIRLTNSGADISKMSAFEDQEEVLIRAGAHFKVVEKTNLNKDKAGSKPNFKIVLQEKPE